MTSPRMATDDLEPLCVAFFWRNFHNNVNRSRRNYTRNASQKTRVNRIQIALIDKSVRDF